MNINYEIAMAILKSMPVEKKESLKKSSKQK